VVNAQEEHDRQDQEQEYDLPEVRLYEDDDPQP
jgi:hypothetical protein